MANTVIQPEGEANAGYVHYLPLCVTQRPYSCFIAEPGASSAFED
jgi:hypothetical protein